MIQKILFVLSALLATLFILYITTWIVGGFFPELYLREWAFYFLNKTIGGLASGTASFASVIWFYLSALIVGGVMLYGLYRGVKYFLK